MGCNTRAAFSSWVYKNIYKIVSIYDSAWRSGADVSLKLAAPSPLEWYQNSLLYDSGKNQFYMVKAGPTLTHQVSQTKLRPSKSDRTFNEGAIDRSC